MEEKRKEKSRERERERETSSYERSIEVAILIEKAKMPCAHALKLH